MALTGAMKTELTQHLKDLHLPTIRECYTEQADKARKEDLAHERYLLELARRESEVRRANRIARLLREPRLPLEKNLETFDRKRLPARVHQPGKNSCRRSLCRFTSPGLQCRRDSLPRCPVLLAVKWKEPLVPTSTLTCYLCQADAQERPPTGDARIVRCPGCLSYRLSGSAEQLLKNSPLDTQQRATASGWLREHPDSLVTTDIVEKLRNMGTPNPTAKSMKLLAYCVFRTIVNTQIGAS